MKRPHSVLRFIFAVTFILLGFWAASTVSAQEDLDTILARGAARGFLTTLTRADLTSVQNFYLVDGVDPKSWLGELKEQAVSRFEISEEGWADNDTYQVTAMLYPMRRTLMVQTGQHEGRWKVESLVLMPLTGAKSIVTTTVTAPALTVTTTLTDFAPMNNGLSGLIAFQTHSGNDIYVIRANGTGLRKVTTGIDPELSPDGKKIAFTRWLPDYAFYTINVDGTNEQRWAAGWRQMKSPSWSADGKRIVFSYQQGGRLDERQVEYNPVELFKDGEEPPQLPSAGWVRDFEYDQKTGLISYKVAPDAYWHLQQMDITTGQYVDTQSGSPYSYGPSFHPTDPNKIIFRGDKGLGLYEVNSKITQRISEDVGDKAAVISPNGQKIALSMWQNGHWEVQTMNVDGSGRQQLTATPLNVIANRQVARQEVYVNEEGYRTIRTTQGEAQPNADWQWSHAAPAWSPDSQHILFVTNRSGKWEFWLMNADGSDQHPMFTNGALDNISLQYDGVDERMVSWRAGQ